MSYTRTYWKDNETPLNAHNLNNMEEGICEALSKFTNAGIDVDGNLYYEDAFNHKVIIGKVTGAPGQDGVSVDKTEINDKGEIVITLSNGSENNLGVIHKHPMYIFRDTNGNIYVNSKYKNDSDLCVKFGITGKNGLPDFVAMYAIENDTELVSTTIPSTNSARFASFTTDTLTAPYVCYKNSSDKASYTGGNHLSSSNYPTAKNLSFVIKADGKVLNEGSGCYCDKLNISIINEVCAWDTCVDSNLYDSTSTVLVEYINVTVEDNYWKVYKTIIPQQDIVIKNYHGLQYSLTAYNKKISNDTKTNDKIVRYIGSSSSLGKFDKETTVTVVTPAGDYNRVKISLPSAITSYVKYVDKYTVNANGDYVWEITFDTPEELTQYAIDGRLAGTGTYIANGDTDKYTYFTLDPQDETKTLSVESDDIVNSITYRNVFKCSSKSVDKYCDIVRIIGEIDNIDMCLLPIGVGKNLNCNQSYNAYKSDGDGGIGGKVYFDPIANNEKYSYKGEQLYLEGYYHFYPTTRTSNWRIKSEVEEVAIPDSGTVSNLSAE